MAWTNRQKQIAVRAFRAAGLEDTYRKLVLRQFTNAMFDAQGRNVDEPTSTSKRLTNQDFEQFMAIIERSCGGKVMHFQPGYWREKAGDHLHRMRHRVGRIVHVLEISGWLKPDGVGLAGWILKRVTGGETDRIEQLDYHRLSALLNGLTNYARCHRSECA